MQAHNIVFPREIAASVRTNPAMSRALVAAAALAAVLVGAVATHRPVAAGHVTQAASSAAKAGGAAAGQP